MLTRDDIDRRLVELHLKHQKISDAWKKTGNKPLLEFFVEIIPKALNAERCSIFVLDPESDNVWLQSGTGLKERQFSVPRTDSLVGQVITSGQYLMDTDLDQRVGAHEWVDTKTGFQTRSVLCVPVRGVSVDKVTGAIQVLNKKGHNAAFKDEDRLILEKLATLIQTHIESLFLHQQMAKLMDDMSRVIKKLEAQIGTLK